MRLKLIIGLILLLPFFGFSQGEFNNWHFGNKAGITFNSGSPVALSDGQMVVKRGSVCVSDSLGNLLFYSDGDRVWNRNHQVMPNGTGLQAGRESDQTISVIQKIEDDSSYYIFTMKCIYLPITSYGGLHYSVVNMRLDGGLGDIEPGQKEIALQTMNDFPELMTTVRHGNNRDAWVIVRNMFNANNFAAFLVTAAGISTTPVISQSSLAWNPIPYGNAGTMRVSPDGAKLVYPHMDTIEFCNFNATTGQITPQFLIRPGTYLESAPWGYLEFSLDSRYLYCSTGDWPWSPSNIYQYDASWTDSTRFKESEMLVGYRNTGVHLQRGPDGKIYGGEAGKDSLSVIHNPALPGIACNYQPHAIFLQGRQCYEGMPDLLQRYYVYIGHSGNCRWNPVQFNPIVWPPADSVYWDFGDPGSGTSNFSNVIHALHTYSSPGVYPVHLFVRHNDKRTDTTSMSLTINPGVDVNVGPNREICLGDSVTFNAVGCSGCTFQWSNLTTGQINIGNTQTLKTGTAGIYLIEATGANGCIDQDTVQLVTDSVPQVMNGELSKTICSGDTTKIALISNVSGTIFHWLATLTSGAVTGFSADSGEVINQTLVNTGSIAGVVTYQITPKVGECWGAQVDFPVTVNVGDSVKVSIIASVNNICEGAPVIFTATPTNPGSNPVFQWKVHSLNAGINSPALTYIPANGDVVQCILTSSNTVCTSNNPATSNSITMVVNPLQLVSVSISP
ncbi:MAG: hypothetical protein NT004_05725, partial [Bacteroidetes bacterium]|nr:hypothetical protein [Bacteroidota bacterium]